MTQRSRNHHNSKRIGIVLGSLALMAGSLILNPFQGAATASADLDTTAPTTSISFPWKDSLLRGTTSVNANATDNIGVSKVEFYVDGALKATDTTSTYSFSWNTTQGTDGAHTLMAKAYDAAGNSASNSITVKVDNTVPVVAISNLLAGQSVAGMITVSGTSTDIQGIKRLALYVDGGKVASKTLLPALTSAPFNFSYYTTLIGNGQHTVKIVATDLLGNEGTQSVTVTVAN
jgi:hypothetical protein